jgi:hypothetical protein
MTTAGFFDKVLIVPAAVVPEREGQSEEPQESALSSILG